jgi:hypothetical protein
MIYDQLAKKHNLKLSEAMPSKSVLSQAQQQQIAARFPHGPTPIEEQINNILRYLEARKDNG